MTKKEKIEEDKTEYINISQAEKRLKTALKKNGYTKLKFETPEVQKDLIVSFSVQDEKMGREEYDSRQGLKKLIQKTLKETNWTLMSDGVYYKLGFLIGRLRGREKQSQF